MCVLKSTGFGYIMLKISVQRTTYDKVNRQITEWENIFVKSKIDKGLIFIFYSKLLCQQ